MKRKIITTSDGSKTIQIEDWNEQYHSIHGAINEANHVFIKQGLLFFLNENNLSNSEISILEVGFGTGLNTLITERQAKQYNLKINYVGVEAFPVKEDEYKQLNYVSLIPDASPEIFNEMHEVNWEETYEITSNFKLTKQKKEFRDISDNSKYNIIYFDAFGARVQPELWTEAIFEIMYKALKPNGVLVTYSAKGSVRRAMQAVGFTVERLGGPPGKRHMLRAIKR